jgi:signal peptidase I
MPPVTLHSSVRTTRHRAGLLGVGLVVAFGVVLLVRSFLVSWYPVVSDSMAPTVDRGDIAVVDKLVWRWGQLDRGDVVTFTLPDDGGVLIKRVVGLPGDTITIEDAILRVNGTLVPEPYVDHSRIDGLYFGPVVIAPNHVFLLGDNRFASTDSRDYGPVPIDSLTGRHLFTVG